MLNNYCKKKYSLEGSVASKHMQAESLLLGKLARYSLFELTEHISSINIYVVRARHFSSTGPVLLNVGGVVSAISKT